MTKTVGIAAMLTALALGISAFAADDQGDVDNLSAVKDGTSIDREPDAEHNPATDNGKSEDGRTKEIDVFAKQMKDVVAKYYPQVVLWTYYDKKTDAEIIHFEYNTYPIIIRYRGKDGMWEQPQKIRGPYAGGVWGEMKFRKGRYEGDVVDADKGVTEISPDYYNHFYTPYSKTLDRHMAAKLRYTAGTNEKFVRQFDELTKNFERYIGKPAKEEE
jgi:hypothetical protein